jgi:hypothetical protein
MAEVDPAVTSRGLARNAIGLREVLFQSITHMAPAAAVAFSIIVGAGFAGAALPLAVILAVVACLSVAYCIGELAPPSLGRTSSRQVPPGRSRTHFESHTWIWSTGWPRATASINWTRISL